MDEIKRLTPTQRPAFLHVFIWNWGADLSLLPEAMKRLGDGYQAVLPEQLSGLARQYMAQTKLLLRAPRSAVAVAGRALQFDVEARNTTAEPLALSAAVSGLAQGRITPTSGSAPGWGAVPLTVTGEPQGDRCQVTVDGSFGQRRAQVNLRLLPQSEMAGELPKRPLSFVEVFSAAQLAHRSGQAAGDAQALAGQVWTATQGATAAGHIVFGPYRPTPAGRYVAAFRLKRTGPGEGLCLKLDTAVGGGGSPSSAQRDLRAEDLPLGQWRCVPLTFEHPGGALETRVFWTGAASVAADSIVLWAVR